MSQESQNISYFILIISEQESLWGKWIFSSAVRKQRAFVSVCLCVCLYSHKANLFLSLKVTIKQRSWPQYWVIFRDKKTTKEQDSLYFVSVCDIFIACLLLQCYGKVTEAYIITHSSIFIPYAPNQLNVKFQTSCGKVCTCHKWFSIQPFICHCPGDKWGWATTWPHAFPPRNPWLRAATWVKPRQVFLPFLCLPVINSFSFFAFKVGIKLSQELLIFPEQASISQSFPPSPESSWAGSLGALHIPALERII